MATTVYFDNRQVTLPGAYSNIVSGERNPARNLDYGKVLVIDTGVLSNAKLDNLKTAYFGGGAGIAGETASGAEAVYTFTNIDDFKKFIKGGGFYKLSDPLFYPDPNNADAVGISEIYFVRAAKTTAPVMTFTATGGGENGGTFKVKCKDEGTGANGVVTGTNLSSGYGFIIVPGVEDPAKFILQIWGGTFTGLYEGDNLPFDGVTALNSQPILYAESPEFDNIQTLLDWANTSAAFNNYFVLDSSSVVTGTGAVVASDVENYGAWSEEGGNLATGGTITYDTGGTTTYLDQVLSAVADSDYNMVFTDQFGSNAYGTVNRKILQHINNDSRFKRFLWVGAYNTKDEFSESLAVAQNFDNCYVQVVHGEVGMASELIGTGYRWWGVMYNLASMVGRTAGKPPYVPITQKSIGIDKLRHILSKDEQKQALKRGLLVTIFNADTGNFVILQGVNTLQDNESLFNSKGQSFSIQFMRIVDQLNRELVINSSIDLLSDENGVNTNTLRAGDVQNWTVAYLQSRVATISQDNLILSFKDVVTTKKEDYYYTTYKIMVNNEITKLFFQGYLIRA